MGYNTNVGQVDYTSTAGQTLFSFLFKIYEDSDVSVSVDGVISSNYTVNIIGDTGGTITFNTGLSAGQAVRIYRTLDIDRYVEYENNGDLRAETLNMDQNYQTYLIADEKLNAGNSYYKNNNNASYDVSTEMPIPVPNTYLAWSGDGKSLVNQDSSSTVVGSFHRIDGTATDGQTVVTVSPYVTDSLNVYLNGSILKFGTDYTVTQNTVVFSVGMELGDEYSIIIGSTSANTSLNVFYVDTVEQLSSLSSAYQTVIVTDPLRGGTFNYRGTTQDDGGVWFNGWEREYYGAVNVEWFDLDVNDASIAINNALSYYHNIVLPDTDITIKTSINLKSNMSMRGQSMEGSNILRDINVPPFDMIVGNGVTKVALENFSVDGVQLEDVAIASNRFCGIRIHGLNNSDIFINRVGIFRTTSGEIQAEGSRSGIALENVFNATIKNCYAIYNRATVFATFGTTNYIMYEGNSIYGEYGTTPNVGAVGSSISGQGDNINVVNNICIGGGYSNISVNGKNSTVVGNISKNSLYSGINIGHGSLDSNADGTTVSGNVCDGNTLDGISSSGSSDVTISGNILRNNTRNGIGILLSSSFTDAMNNININNNTISKNLRGVYLGYGSKHNISNNMISDNTSTGVYVAYDGLLDNGNNSLKDITIKSNIIADNGSSASYGILTSTSPYTRSCSFFDNVIKSSDNTTKQGIGIGVSGANTTGILRTNIADGLIENYKKLSGGLFSYKTNDNDSAKGVTFINGYSSQSGQPVTYRKDNNGYVHIEGSVTGGTLNQSAFVLPEGYRPLISNTVSCVANNAFGRTTISTTGNVYIYDDATNHNLSGISFKAVEI